MSSRTRRHRASPATTTSPSPSTSCMPPATCARPWRTSGRLCGRAACCCWARSPAGPAGSTSSSGRWRAGGAEMVGGELVQAQPQSGALPLCRHRPLPEFLGPPRLPGIAWIEVAEAAARLLLADAQLDAAGVEVGLVGSQLGGAGRHVGGLVQDPTHHPPRQPAAAITPPSPTTVPARSGSVPRSEEHTSELQSLMRISYAVFCLTKKKKT